MRYCVITTNACLLLYVWFAAPVVVAKNTSTEADEVKSRQKLTKRQKRRLAGQIDHSTGEKPRGWNWVDLVSHLQKGPSRAGGR